MTFLPPDRAAGKITDSLIKDNYTPVMPASDEIVLYRHNGNHRLAVVDGTPFALVDRSSVTALMEAVNALNVTNSKTKPPFSTEKSGYCGSGKLKGVIILEQIQVVITN